VRRHVSGEVVHLIPPFSAVYPGIQQWKNYWNVSTSARVMRHNVCAPFVEIVYCISTHLTFHVSQGSAATDLRWGGNFNKFLFRNSTLYIVMKKLRKSVNICLSYRKNKSVSFFYGTQCTMDYKSLVGYKQMRLHRLINNETRVQPLANCHVHIQSATENTCHSERCLVLPT